MANNYSITFKSLRAGTTYTVNIGGGTGAAIPLKGGAQPFVTQEDENEDQFALIRTQSGYIRIVDDGYDDQATPQAFDWHDLVPEDDTDRPVTLSHVENNATVIDWVGFMQAQDFGQQLFGNPQEREFPIQCVLSVTQCTDINYEQTQVQNFAYLLKQIVDSIPSAQRPQSFVIQGGAHAQEWLLKKIDWQNFVAQGDGDTLSARYNMFECLEDMCRFWGWTARTCGTTMYLTCSDDQTEQTFLTLTYANLTTMAGGTAAGSTNGAYTTLSYSGDIFANDNNDDYVQRGAHKASVVADAGQGDTEILMFADQTTEKEMKNQEWGQGQLIDGKYIQYTNDLYAFNRPFIHGVGNSTVGAVRSYGSFNMVRISEGGSNPSASEMAVIRIGNKYENNNVYASLETVYAHCFEDGYFSLHGLIYKFYQKIENVDGDNDWGSYKMWMRLGIGPSHDDENTWWYNGNEWQQSSARFQVTIGNSDDLFRVYYNGGAPHNIEYFKSQIHVSKKIGNVFIDFMGTTDQIGNDWVWPIVVGNESFDINGFSLEFSRSSIRYGLGSLRDNADRNARRTYTSVGTGKNVDEWSTNGIYASENDTPFAYGLLINPDGSYMTGVTYGSSTIDEKPEQHLADRVTAFGNTSKRRMSVELRRNAIIEPTPQNFVTLDGTTCHPIAISHDWRDDIIQLTLLEMPVQS